MSALSFNFVTAENGQKFITVYHDGILTPPADDSHPNFTAIVGACQAIANGEDIDHQDVIDLFDVAATVERKFARLSERVTVENGEVLFDGDPAQTGLSAQILRFMDEGEDFEPLVNFMEKVQSNPQSESREQAWDWFNNHDFTITEDGDVVIYKGVSSDDAGGYTSGWEGTAMVNDVLYEGQRIPYAVGDTVTMPRSAVDYNPSSACSHGLHVGTYGYASRYGERGCMLRCIVNPRDVVSVPTDARGQKIRVCRFYIDAIIEDADASAIYRPTEVDRLPDEDEDIDLDVTLSDARDPHALFVVGQRVRDAIRRKKGTVQNAPAGQGWVPVLYDGNKDVSVVRATRLRAV